MENRCFESCFSVEALNKKSMVEALDELKNVLQIL